MVRFSAGCIRYSLLRIASCTSEKTHVFRAALRSAHPNCCLFLLLLLCSLPLFLYCFFWWVCYQHIIRPTSIWVLGASLRTFSGSPVGVFDSSQSSLHSFLFDADHQSDLSGADYRMLGASRMSQRNLFCDLSDFFLGFSKRCVSGLSPKHRILNYCLFLLLF